MMYVKTAFAIAGERFIADAEAILEAFNEEIQTSCIGSVSECFEGDPPFHARGCVSQATSVGGLLYISDLIGEWKKKSGKVVAEKPAAKRCAAKSTKSAKAKAEVESVSEEPKKKCVRKKK